MPSSKLEESRSSSTSLTEGVNRRTVHAVVADREISETARALVRDSEVVDLHIDTFIPMRLFGWSLAKRHGLGLTRGWFLGHLDLPRIKDGGLTGAMWSITTNPFRTARGRWATFQRNLTTIQDKLRETNGAIEIARTASEYKAARAKGAHVCMLSVQGGNAFDAAPESARSVPDRLITRVTLVHLTNSWIGTSSAPVSMLRRNKKLSDRGRELVRAMNEARIFVDLAHIHPDSFWDVVSIHDKSQPLVATHTGVTGVTKHWRNLDDRQIKAIADTGGTIGIIYAVNFLSSKNGPKDGQMVVEHMRHIIDVAGEDFVSIGSDYDGMITPPRGLRSGDSYPRLVQYMLDRGWSDLRIKKILGTNFLRAFEMIRP